MQNHYNLVYREEEREMIPLCLDQGVGLIPWSPLARGFLAGNRSRQDQGETTRARSDQFAHDMYYEENDFAIVDRVVELAEQKGVSATQPYRILNANCWDGQIVSNVLLASSVMPFR
jgi:aryl-alcohol dehydrogenase (NADP+)